MSRAKTVGLPGLVRVKEALGMDNRTIAEMAQVREQFISRVINGSADCSLNVLRRLADNLDPFGIKVEDLTGPIQERRFLELKAQRLEAELDSVRSALQ